MGTGCPSATGADAKVNAFATAPHPQPTPNLTTPALLELLEVSTTVSPDDLSRARAAAAQADKRIDQALVELGLMTAARLRTLLAEQLGIADIADAELPETPLFPDRLGEPFLRHAGVLPIRVEDEVLVLCMLDPLDDFAANAVALKLNLPVRRLRLSSAQLETALQSFFGVANDEAEEPGATLSAAAVAGDAELLRDAASGAPVVRFVQDMLRQAVERGASDIHLRQGRTGPQLLFRIHGDLMLQAAPDAGMFPSIISRLKILAHLDIAEQRLPQDGRMRTNVAGRPVDIRVATMPHLNGEGVVLRLLSRDLGVSGLAELGFSETVLTQLVELFAAPDGLVLVTGPTGSGKTTTRA
jgi:general secretion pathway protein E